MAAHFDSIAIHASAQSDTNSAYGARSFLTTLIELPAALGAVPATISVTTANGVEHWQAYELLELSAPGASNDSAFILLAFRDGDAHTAFLADFDSAGSIQDAGLVTGDTIFVNPSDGSGSTSLTSMSTTCTTPSASLLNPALGTLGFSSCTLAKFHTSVSLTLPSTAGMDEALTSVSFANATVNGIRAVDAISGTQVRRVKTLLRAAAAKRRY